MLFDMTGSYTYTFITAGLLLAFSGAICIPLRSLAEWEQRVKEGGHKKMKTEARPENEFTSASLYTVTEVETALWSDPISSHLMWSVAICTWNLWFISIMHFSTFYANVFTVNKFRVSYRHWMWYKIQMMGKIWKSSSKGEQFKTQWNFWSTMLFASIAKKSNFCSFHWLNVFFCHVLGFSGTTCASIHFEWTICDPRSGFQCVVYLH